MANVGPAPVIQDETRSGRWTMDEPPPEALHLFQTATEQHHAINMDLIPSN